MSTYHRLFVGAWLTTLSGATCASDPNLLPNGDFRTSMGVTGWTAFPAPNGPVSWNSDDALGSSGSGSMELQNGGPDNAYLPAYVDTCFDVTPGAAYSIGGESRIVAGTMPTLQFTYCDAHPAPNCAGGFVGSLNLPTVPQNSAWTVWTPSSGLLPANARSVSCGFALYDYTVSAVARIDNLFFNSVAPTTSVRLQTFEVR